MRALGTTILCLLAGGCASTEQQGEPNLLSAEARAQAKVDETRAYLEAVNLPTVHAIQMSGSMRLQSSNRRFAVIKVNSSTYILETERECPGLETRGVELGMVDFRMQRRILRAGYDTIRGCRIKSIYKLQRANSDTSESNAGDASVDEQ